MYMTVTASYRTNRLHLITPPKEILVHKQDFDAPFQVSVYSVFDRARSVTPQDASLSANVGGRVADR